MLELIKPSEWMTNGRVVQWTPWLISAHLNKVFTSLGKDVVHFRKVLDGEVTPIRPIGIEAS